jgi:hypothetical protein
MVGLVIATAAGEVDPYLLAIIANAFVHGVVVRVHRSALCQRRRPHLRSIRCSTKVSHRALPRSLPRRISPKLDDSSVSETRGQRYAGGSSDRSVPASRRRIPAAPFLSNTSRTPPASMARRIAIKLLGRSLCSPLSNAAIARSETFACLASSNCDHRSQPRAARHCSGVMDPARKEILCGLSILLELGRYS